MLDDATDGTYTKTMKPEQIKQSRLKRKLKQREVAARIGVTLRAYQRYESGERVPNGTAMARLIALYAGKKTKGKVESK